MARAREALPAPTPPRTTALSCSRSLSVHSRESWWTLSNDGPKYLWLEPDCTAALHHNHPFLWRRSQFTAAREASELGGYVEWLGGSAGYRPRSASLRNKRIQALARRMGTAREEKLHTQVHRECLWVKYGLLQIKQKPQSSPKQTLLETRYYLLDTHPH